MLARSTIIMGAFLNPTMMSVYIGAIIMLGTLFIYVGLFKRDRENAKKHVVRGNFKFVHWK